MKIGYFSPLPPALTGVADYSAALLPYLRAIADVEVDAESADVNLYHIGNNHLHREIYQRALAQPGVIVLHDAVLHHFMLGTLARDAYIEEFVYNYGEWSRSLAQDLWRERARSGSDPRYFAHPMIKRIVECARAVIVHNPAAARMVRDHAAGARIAEIPHLFRSPELPDRVSATSGPLLLGVFGHQRETKRLPVVLRAFRRAVDSGADAALVVSGAFVSEPYERSLEPLLRHPRIQLVGYLPEAEFWRQAAALDLSINLRYPTAGETSGIAISMMGIGKAVVFTAGEETSRFPENACLRVEVGPNEEDTLAGYIEWMAGNRTAAASIGQRAAAYIAREHAPEHVARAYWDVLERAFNTA